MSAETWLDQYIEETKPITGDVPAPGLRLGQYGPQFRDNEPVLGQVRRSSDGLTAVRVSVDSYRPWHLIGPDPVPGGYGWRTAEQVAGWAVVGNVLEGGQS